MSVWGYIFAIFFIVASAGAMAIALYWQELKPVRNRCQEVWTYSKKYPVSAFTNTLLESLFLHLWCSLWVAVSFYCYSL